MTSARALITKAVKIEVEGTDGAGKTTALKYLIQQLEARQQDVLETREVGAPMIPTNVKLRELVLDPNSNLSGEAMEFIFAAMRIENDRYYKTVTDKDFIVSDRGWLSHLAYTDHNVDEEFTNLLYTAVGQLTTMPDVVIYLNVNTETALQRRVKRGTGMDVIEMKGVGFQEKVRESFSKYIGNMKDALGDEVRIFEVDANDTVEGVRKQVDIIVDQLLNTNQ